MTVFPEPVGAATTMDLSGTNTVFICSLNFKKNHLREMTMGQIVLLNLDIFKEKNNDM